MYKIACCDDQESVRETLLIYLTRIEEKWKESFDIFLFETGSALIESLIDHHYDIILLDILMDNLDGIETANKIRSLGEDSKIIFISNFDKRWRELIRVGTSAFIDKPIKVEELEEVLWPIIQRIKQTHELIFIYYQNKNKFFIPMKDIIFLEAKRNNILLKTAKDDLQYIGTIKEEWSKLLCLDYFIMPSRSFIVNLNYATLKSHKIIITQKELCNIGRKYYEDTMDRYAIFLERRSKI
ncbi:LytR/AlgR family response regulator transcription factor [Anaerotignum propionicum]|uniref:LytR/AlgR family response regulator transcription factor n=1 Tax=Anaerotignum propionicum TaxID=28446 RepID=UPI002109A894|nr:LytTR family DNA-binding domain-containing protein [Anaerotignum propionicum]MCQ4935556.1 LytTR family DNA-binding domain-containing protein [Anaerotignum propionicum]